MEEMEETLQYDGLNVTALMFLFWQASSHGDGNNSDINSLSSDMLDIILHEDSCSGTGSATSGSMGSGSNGCGTSASGTSNSGTSKSRNSASGTSSSGTGLFQHLMNILRYLNFTLSQWVNEQEKLNLRCSKCDRTYQLPQAHAFCPFNILCFFFCTRQC